MEAEWSKEPERNKGRGGRKGGGKTPEIQIQMKYKYKIQIQCKYKYKYKGSVGRKYDEIPGVWRTEMRGWCRLGSLRTPT